jgi:peptide/nickel transport system permease protein
MLMRYVLGRLVSTALTFLAITLFVFVAFFRIPEANAGRQHPPDQYRIHGSLLGQYVHYLWALVRHGDLGYSYATREAVTTRLLQGAPVTLSLVLGGLVVWLLIALPLGILSALRPRRLADRVSTLFVFAGVSIHPVWLGLMLSWTFGRYLHVVPAAGYCSITDLSTGCDGLGHWASHLLLPWLTFGLVNAALFTTMVRALLQEELKADYVRTALGKGAGSLRIVRAHLLRNVMLPLTTMVGLLAGTSVAGVIFVESAFNLPGLGGTLRQATLRQDLPMTAGAVIFLTLAVVALNLVVDLAYAVVDPRVRLMRG